MSDMRMFDDDKLPGAHFYFVEVLSCQIFCCVTALGSKDSPFVDYLCCILVPRTDFLALLRVMSERIGQSSSRSGYGEKTKIIIDFNLDVYFNCLGMVYCCVVFPEFKRRSSRWSSVLVICVCFTVGFDPFFLANPTKSSASCRLFCLVSLHEFIC